MSCGLACFLINYTEIVNLFGKSDYLKSHTVAVILSPYPIFMLLSYIVLILAILKKKTKYISHVYLITAVINIVLNLILVPALGIEGSAIATTVSFLLLCIIIVKATSFSLKDYRIEGRKLVREILIMCLMIFVFSIVNLVGVSINVHIMVKSIVYLVVFFILILSFRIVKKQDLNDFRSIS